MRSPLSSLPALAVRPLGREPVERVLDGFIAPFAPELVTDTGAIPRGETRADPTFATPSRPQ